MIENLERRIQLTAGLPDPNLGSSGLVQAHFAGTYDEANGVVIDSANRILVSGSTSPDLKTFQPLIARYLSSGELDTTFGDGGEVTSNFGLSNSVVAKAVAMPDGRIFALIQSESGDSGNRLICLHGNGSLDKKFGDGGELPTVAGDFAVASDGSIFLLTSHDLRRFRSNGLPDHSFGDQGKLVVDDSRFFLIELQSVTASADDFFVSATMTEAGSMTDGVSVLKFSSSGALDQTYATDGIATSTNTRGQFGISIAVEQDGSVLLGSNDDDVIIRFKPDGQLDSGFGVGGVVDGFGGDIHVDSQGRIIAFGSLTLVGDPTIDRYTPQGQLDQSFSADGVAEALEPIHTEFNTEALAIDTSDNVVIAGRIREIGTNPTFAAISRLDGGVATSIATIKGGTLRFSDYDQSDQIQVGYNGSSITFSLNNDDLVASVSAKKVHRIIVNGNGGDDRLISTLGDVPNLAQLIFAGDGGDDSLDDTSSGAGKFVEMFYGGPGHDILMTNSQHASLDGGSGDDSIDDRNGGFSTLTGDAGNDTFNSQNQLPDTIDGGAGNDTAYYDSSDSLQSVEAKEPLPT